MCWHKWNVYKEVRWPSRIQYIITTKKVCRKCKEIRIREKIY